jgi:hypothetical protein
VTREGGQPSNPSSARPNAWLNQYARNVHSQFGEDGIVERILDSLPTTNQWCVEFGAQDGESYSNSANLIVSRNYRAVLIEPNAARYAKLQRRYEANSRVITLRQSVGFGALDNLDAVLAPLAAPIDFDLLSIDIDGNDYNAWAASNHYRPKIVIIEFNPTIASGVAFVQEADPTVKHGSSISSIYALARDKKYELAAVTWTNAVFVDAKYFPVLGIADNSVHALRLDCSGVTHFFYGYDGSVFLRGQRNMVWHGVALREAAAQQLPFFIRGFPQEFGRLRTTALKLFRRLRSLMIKFRGR